MFHQCPKTHPPDPPPGLSRQIWSHEPRAEKTPPPLIHFIRKFTFTRYVTAMKPEREPVCCGYYRPLWLLHPPPRPCPLSSGVVGISGPEIRRPSGLPARFTASEWPAVCCATRQLSAPGQTRRQRGRLFSKESVLWWGED